MMTGKSKIYLVLFSAGLLFLSAVIRSGIIVDRSFLPRFIGLSLLLFVTVILFLRKAPLLKRNSFTCFLILYYLWNLTSITWAWVPSESVMQSQLVFLALAVYLIVSQLNYQFREFENIFYRTFLFLLLFSFVIAFYRISILAFFDPYRILGISANNNLYAGFLLLSLPLLLNGYALNRGFWKYLFALTGILSIYFIVILQSRAVYIGLTVSVFILITLILLRFRTKLTGRNIFTGVGALIILAVAVFIFYHSLDVTRKGYFMSKVAVWEYFRTYDKGIPGKDPADGKMLATNTEVSAFDYSEEYHENANLRMIFWKKSSGMIEDHPLCGVGAGNWRIRIPAYSMPANPEHTQKNFTYSQPHNEWISILSELGIPGSLLAIMVFFIPVAFLFYRLVFRSGDADITALFYGAFVFGFYLYASFDFPLHRVEHNLLLFSIFALMLDKVSAKRGRFVILGRVPKLHDGLANVHLSSRHKNLRKLVLINGLIAILLAFNVIVGTYRIIGEYYTLKMFRSERKEDDKVILYAEKAENPFYRITPNTLPVEWFEGVAFYRKGDFSEALDHFRGALKVTPWEVRVLNDYATALYSLNDTLPAKKVFRDVIALDPFFDDARFNLAAILYNEGKSDSAMDLVEHCRESIRKTEFQKTLDRENQSE